MTPLTLTLCLFLLHAASPSVQAAPPWTTVMIDDGRLSVAMPAAATSSAVVTATPAGPLVTHTVSSNDATRAEFNVSWTDYAAKAAPLAPAGTAGARACDAIAKAKEARRLESAPVTVEGRPGQSCTLAEPDGTLTKALFFSTDRRFYQVMAVVRGQNGAADADRFLTSLRWR